MNESCSCLALFDCETVLSSFLRMSYNLSCAVLAHSPHIPPHKRAHETAHRKPLKTRTLDNYDHT